MVKLAEGGDAGVVCRFLAAKLTSCEPRDGPGNVRLREYLVAREAKDNETLVL